MILLGGRVDLSLVPQMSLGIVPLPLAATNESLSELEPELEIELDFDISSGKDIFIAFISSSCTCL